MMMMIKPTTAAIITIIRVLNEIYLFSYSNVTFYEYDGAYEILHSTESISFP